MAWVDNLRWTDALDIALLWFLLYRILLLLRGTRAIQSLLGLLVVLLIYVLSGWFQLYALHWMLETFFGYIVLALIILFQSDIKRGLATAGGRLFPSFKGKPDTGATEEIIRASFQMASRRIGALIALEREASLDDYVDAGQRIEARVMRRRRPAARPSCRTPPARRSPCSTWRDRRRCRASPAFPSRPSCR